MAGLYWVVTEYHLLLQMPYNDETLFLVPYSIGIERYHEVKYTEVLK